MDRQAYMKQFSRWLRWRVTENEAAEILSDYEELLHQRPAAEDAALLQDMGRPDSAARLLTDPKQYHRWLAVFGCMVFCLLMLEAALLRAAFARDPSGWTGILLALGVIVSLICFHHRAGSQKSPVPKRLVGSLLAVAVAFGAAGMVFLCLNSGAWEHWPPEWYGITAHWVLCVAGTVGGIAGLFGLVNARISDRRWSALYILGLTVLAICVMGTAFLVRLDLSADSGWWVPYAIRWGAAGVFGLAGVGASLC